MRSSIFAGMVLASVFILCSGDVASVIDDLACSVCEVPKVSGMIGDCCCEAETVHTANRDLVKPLLDELATTKFFRFFKVDLWKDCPFWQEDSQCNNQACAVGECSPDDIPAPWQQEDAQDPQAGCGAEERELANPLGDVQRSSQQVGRDFFGWAIGTQVGAGGSADDRPGDLGGDLAGAGSDSTAWADQRETDSSLGYVDLIENPEGYTGYTNPHSGRIWSAIYDENCFDEAVTGDGSFECLEERVFYRMISGLQTSINTHIALRYRVADDAWGKNLSLYKQRVARFPERLDNLYFAYLFVMRAFAKIRPKLQQMDFYTGNIEEDNKTRALVLALIEATASVPELTAGFDESKLFKVSTSELLEQCGAVVTGMEQIKELTQRYKEQAAQKQKLFTDFRAKYRNISRIMDCVGCEKCRMWGKLQFLGLGTAQKILFADDSTPQWYEMMSLERNEVVALVNVLHRLAISVQAIEDMRGVEFRGRLADFALYGAASVALLGVLVWALLYRRQQTRIKGA